MLEDNLIEVEPQENKTYLVYSNYEVRVQKVIKLITLKKVFEWSTIVKVALCIDLESKTERIQPLTGKSKSIFLEFKK